MLIFRKNGVPLFPTTRGRLVGPLIRRRRVSAKR
jgi:hypothetical protein